MAHLDEGSLQSFLDAELTGRDRAGAAEHLLICGECRAELDALRRANRCVTDALSLVDLPAPAVAPPRAARAHRRAFGGPLVKAAVMVLVVAAAASASVPGSPIREWIAQAVRPADELAAPAPAEPVVTEAPAPARPAAPAGIALAGVRDVDVVVSGLDGVAIRLVRSDEPAVSVSAVGGSADPLFRMGAGRIEVVGGAGGELVVAVPRTGSNVRLVVDGRRYATVTGAQLELEVPAEQDGEAVVWP